MHYRVIACDVLTRELCWCAARTPNTLDITFTAKGEHDNPARLRDLLQQQIDAAAASAITYDAVLLGYGLCGNATVGLTANTFPLVIPRAHDCTTLFLGSRKAFEEHFGANPSQAWTSIGYSERGDSVISDGDARSFGPGGQSFAELAATYGEENARYLLDAMTINNSSKEIPFLDVPETHIASLVARIREYMAAADKTLQPLPGSLRLIEALLAGDWPEDEFLVAPPGTSIAGVYDYKEVVCANRRNNSPATTSPT